MASEQDFTSTQWDKLYGGKVVGPRWPDDDVVRYLHRYLLKRDDVRRVLDFGCGAGRHCALLADAGYEAHGVDVSENALASAAARLKAQGLKASFVKADMDSPLPFPDGHFDFILCWGLIHYDVAPNRRRAISEIRRLLRPGGLSLMTLRSRRDSLCGTGRKIEENTYEVEDGLTKGIKGMTMHFYDEAEAREFLSGFKNVLLGHRENTKLGSLNWRVAHWIAAVEKA